MFSLVILQGEAGTGNIVEAGIRIHNEYIKYTLRRVLFPCSLVFGRAVRHARSVNGELRRISAMEPCELFSYAKLHGVPIDLVQQVCFRVHNSGSCCTID